MPIPMSHSRAGKASSAIVLFCALLGVLVGSGAFTFYEARGWSYLSNDPAACVNCHIMRDPYDSWQKSSHHGFTTCNDCHVPHDLVGKWATKAASGFRHSWGFTFQDFHEPIRLHHSSRWVLQENCLRCHGEFVSQVVRHGDDLDSDPTNCVRCHAAVGHGGHAD